jgi:hypothetical protein
MNHQMQATISKLTNAAAVVALAGSGDQNSNDNILLNHNNNNNKNYDIQLSEGKFLKFNIEIFI